MQGMSAANGLTLSGDDYRRQTVADILLTPIGARAMRRDYGSLLLALIDQPFNALTRQRLFAATAMALNRWAKWLRLRRVELIAGSAPGVFRLQLTYERTDLPSPSAPTVMTIPLQRRASARSGAALEAGEPLPAPFESFGQADYSDPANAVLNTAL